MKDLNKYVKNADELIRSTVKVQEVGTMLSSYARVLIMFINTYLLLNMGSR